MDLEKHPIKDLSFAKLADRTIEELLELGHALLKWKRFKNRPSPKNHRKAVDMIREELLDVDRCLAELEKRLETM